MHILIKNKLLNCGNYKVKCAVGKRGIKIKKKEGDLITPKGLFKIKRVLYRKDRIGRLNTKLKKTPIKKNMGWCDDPSSKFYNKLINFPFKFNAEKLFKRENIYDIILVLDFNMNPIRKNKGSAIFIHIAKKKFTPTKGCVAISKNVLKKILSKINKDCKVRIT
tara:strand:+ start:555 stop:1046 length:492 start_codon:yes stop_codon:yes gene_type:complete